MNEKLICTQLLQNAVVTTAAWTWRCTCAAQAFLSAAGVTATAIARTEGAPLRRSF